MDTAIQVYAPTAMAIERAPEQVLAEATQAARVLKSVLDAKSNKVMMGGEQYLEFEDWQTLARFYGLTVKEDGDPEYVEIGTARGFKASAVVITRDGDAVSRATAYCLSDEEKWGERPKYVYGYCLKNGGWSVEEPARDQMIWEDNPNKKGGNRPKKERRNAGTESVPIFQLASMAQTRASAKAFRNVLSWVVVLAGYRPTPSEELEGMTEVVSAPSRESAVDKINAVRLDDSHTDGTPSTTSSPKMKQPTPALLAIYKRGIDRATELGLDLAPYELGSGSTFEDVDAAIKALSTAVLAKNAELAKPVPVGEDVQEVLV